MEQLVVFRDRQEIDPADLNGIQTIARTSLDRIVRDAVTDEAKFTGLLVTAASSTGVGVAAGAFVNNGQVYAIATPTPINLYENLPVSTRRYVAIIVSGQEGVPDQIEERDFLIDADSDQVEPQAVPMRLLRQGSVGKVVGSENVDPQLPTLPPSSILVAAVLMSGAGIVSITMAEGNRLPSLKRHGEQLIELDNFRKRAEPQIGALTTQLAVIDARTTDKADRQELLPIKLDLARLKERISLPDDFYDYAADTFDNAEETDPASAAGHTINDGALGFKSVSASKPLSLLNPVEPLVKRFDTDWIQPDFTAQILLEVLGYAGSVNMSSYSTAGLPTKVKKTGVTTTWANVRVDQFGAPGLYMGIGGDGHIYNQVQVNTPYEYYEEVDGAPVIHTGMGISQTVVSPRSFLLSQLGFFIEELDTSGDVTLLVCETKNGKPNPLAVLNKVTVAHADLKSGGLETIATIKSTLWEAGRLYGVILVTNGGHKIAISNAGYTEGQFYYGQNDDWLSVDASKDLKLRFYANKYKRTRTEVALNTVTLSGGISEFVWQTETLQPSGTSVSIEARTGGVWHSLNAGDSFDFLSAEPDTLELRAVFIGTSDLQPAIKLGADKVTLRRVENTLDHLSVVRTLPGAKDDFVIDLLLVNYVDDGDQEVDVTLHTGVGYATETAATSQTVTSEGPFIKRVRSTFHTAAPVTTYQIEIEGGRTNGAPPFLIAERVDAAIN